MKALLEFIDVYLNLIHVYPIGHDL